MAYFRIVFQNLTCVLVAGIAAYYFSTIVGSFYCNIFGNCSAGIASVNFSAVVGLLLGYFIFVPFLLTIFGARGKNWWVVASTTPLFMWAIYMDIRLMQLVPLIVASVTGLILGILAHKVLRGLAPSLMS